MTHPHQLELLGEVKQIKDIMLALMMARGEPLTLLTDTGANSTETPDKKDLPLLLVELADKHSSDFVRQLLIQHGGEKISDIKGDAIAALSQAANDALGQDAA